MSPMSLHFRARHENIAGTAMGEGWIAHDCSILMLLKIIKYIKIPLFTIGFHWLTITNDEWFCDPTSSPPFPMRNDQHIDLKHDQTRQPTWLHPRSHRFYDLTDLRRACASISVVQETNLAHPHEPQLVLDGIWPWCLYPDPHCVHCISPHATFQMQTHRCLHRSSKPSFFPLLLTWGFGWFWMGG